MNFVVVSANQKKTLPGTNGRSPMQVISLVLKEYGQDQSFNAEWFTKGDTQLPQPGAQLEGEKTWDEKFNVWNFKKAGGVFGGGGGGRKDTPETRRSIAAQASQKVAVDAVRVAVEAGLWKPKDPREVVSAVLMSADRLYLRVMAAERDEIKPEAGA